MKNLIITTLCLFSMLVANAQEKKDEFKIKGKVIATVFADMKIGLGSQNDKIGFNLNRSYLGYEAQFTKNLSAKLVFDIGTSKVEGSDLERIAYVKNALINWKYNNLDLNFGLIGLNQFSVQEKFWGYRYLAKSFQDEYSFGSSADMGLSVAYKFADWISADAVIMNGEGYKKLNKDNRFRYGAGITVNPIEQLTFRVYADNYNCKADEDKNQQAIALFLGYKHKVFSIGGEYNMLYNYKFSDGHDRDGFSIYATGNLSKKFKVFGRYDQIQSSDDWNIENDGNKIIGGLEYKIASKLKISPNIQSWKVDGKDAETHLFLSLEFKL